ncbi:hypothetical protein N7G274_002884 [Stereocaulon virgatum]|uniref:Zn(2)-C6 fungal-type domain-containing protein n=1 Tax=Stereocaulon virgatum TaxID=373712 RepID=A0ABR4AHH8_9LECA
MSATETQATKAKSEVRHPAQGDVSPRKRRRRAPATGAAADCFACQERQAKCDRRRPYCTPCLDQGKDCSGYKTQLTWGVGVASRGKLRGLALPIAESGKAVQSNDKDTNDKGSGPQKPAKLGTKRRASDSVGSIQLRSPMSATGTGGSGTPTTYNFVNMDPNSSSSTTSSMHAPPSFDWREASSHSHARDLQPPRKKARRHTLQPLQVPTMHPTRDYGTMPMTASVIGGYGHHDFGLSSQISPMVPSFTGYGIVSPTYKGFTSQPMVDSPCEANFFSGHETIGWPRDEMSSLSSEHSNQDYREHETFYTALIGPTHIGNALPAQQTFPQQDLVVTSASESTAVMAGNKYSDFADSGISLVADDVGDHASLSVPRLLPSLSIGNTPKLQFLIDYYDKVISPVIVAFDGPTNPYRSHILSLAVESETLQHAIAALSASNLRMRRGNSLAPSRSSQSITPSSHDHSVRKSSIAHSLMDGGMDCLPQTSANEPSNEELYHKNTSIKSLNEQLSDPHRRQDDSILATLLILCLYHICDTGVGKFKTQFAGVKKILALRGGTKGNNSKATNWLTIMFTWFDAMTATINDCEGQLDGDDLDMSKLKSDEWALENLAGCDGRLFKIIAKLGRLNLLSQNKPVSDSSPRSSSSPASKPQKLPSPGPKTQDYYSMNYNRFDGNGWSAMIDEEPMETDSRTQFWKEWNNIRQRLTDWQLDDSSSLPRESDRRDLYHISESFRYSALVYTERLAFPHLPSVHPNFQNLVTQALFHISSVKSDVFLLWPLFITGTECVSEQSRYLIRERCLDLQKDSGFFNNISGLELLEKIWRDDDTNDEPMPGLATGLTLPSNEFSTVGGHGFKWRKAMERVDGEYIVV